MTRRVSAWLLLSLAMHGGLAVALTIVLRDVTPPMLLVHLAREIFTREEPPAASPAGRADGAPPAAPVGGAPARRTSRERPTPAPPIRSSPAPVVPVVESPHETNARAAEPPREPASDPVTPDPEPVRQAPRAVSPTPEPVLTAPEPARTAPEASAPSLAPGSGSPSALTGGSRRPGAEADSSTIATQGGGDRTTRTDGGAGPGGRGALASGQMDHGLGARGGGALALAVPGEGGGDGVEYAGYLALLRRRIQASLAYPTLARRRGLTGTVQIELEIQPTGAITRVALAVSSSHRVLDDAALEAVRGIERLPFPPHVRPRVLRVRLPVVFDLR